MCSLREYLWQKYDNQYGLVTWRVFKTQHNIPLWQWGFQIINGFLKKGFHSIQRIKCSIKIWMCQAHMAWKFIYSNQITLLCVKTVSWVKIAFTTLQKAHILFLSAFLHTTQPALLFTKTKKNQQKATGQVEGAWTLLKYLQWKIKKLTDTLFTLGMA